MEENTNYNIKEPEDIFSGCGVQCTFKERDDFLKIKETLTRIGVSSTNHKTLYQSTHLLHKRGFYAILHFKELFILDGKSTNISENDIARRNTIANLLSEWGLLELVDPSYSASPVVPANTLKILTHKDKVNWTIVQKYSIGND